MSENSLFELYKRGKITEEELKRATGMDKVYKNYSIKNYNNDKFNKNDRSLKNYYENDYFGILPDYSDLDVYFEGNNHE